MGIEDGGGGVGKFIATIRCKTSGTREIHGITGQTEDERMQNAAKRCQEGETVIGIVPDDKPCSVNSSD